MPLVNTTNKRYKPSNGTEGDLFISEWCNLCAHYKDDNDDYCEILGLTFSLNIHHIDYPKEWIYDENEQPCCTNYLHNTEKPKPRCSKTIDMFGANN